LLLACAHFVRNLPTGAAPDRPIIGMFPLSIAAPAVLAEGFADLSHDAVGLTGTWRPMRCGRVP
jgi:hypothetical protein